ncbi:hypothetical protein B0H14DRAFT_2568762 [Mycena olivaceomarginata]|nr:hypothetical protein B0H14DRAFT_2568762 [Mycena olivaceomarginata]
MLLPGADSPASESSFSDGAQTSGSHPSLSDAVSNNLLVTAVQREIQGANNSRAEGAGSNGGAGGRGESDNFTGLVVGLVIAALLPEFQDLSWRTSVQEDPVLEVALVQQEPVNVKRPPSILDSDEALETPRSSGLQLAEGADGASKNTHPLRLKCVRKMQEKTQTTEVKAAKVRYALPFTVWERQLREYFVGGKGGQGGSSLQKGGGGGLGEGPQISAAEAQRYREINGGVGGQGGEGGAEGGMGGVSQGPRFAKMLVMMDGKAAARVPHLTIAKFCQQFQLSNKIWRLLEERFETGGGAVGRGRCNAEESGAQGGGGVASRIGEADCGGKEGAEGVCDQRAVSERAG